MPSIVGRDQGWVILRLNSGEQRSCTAECMATVGAVSNPDHMNISIGKAGRNRWLGKRPHNRGVAMNPVDHPHGGGEGRTSGGRHPVTPWGKPTKGKKTRSNKSTDKFIVRRVTEEVRPLGHGSFRLERPVRRRLSAQEGRAARRAAATKSSRSGAVARPSCRSSSA
jgi:hypothetical protein